MADPMVTQLQELLDEWEQQARRHTEVANRLDERDDEGSGRRAARARGRATAFLRAAIGLQRILRSHGDWTGYADMVLEFDLIREKLGKLLGAAPRTPRKVRETLDVVVEDLRRVRAALDTPEGRAVAGWAEETRDQLAEQKRQNRALLDELADRNAFQRRLEEILVETDDGGNDDPLATIERWAFERRQSDGTLSLEEHAEALAAHGARLQAAREIILAEADNTYPDLAAVDAEIETLLRTAGRDHALRYYADEMQVTRGPIDDRLQVRLRLPQARITMEATLTGHEEGKLLGLVRSVKAAPSVDAGPVDPIEADLADEEAAEEAAADLAAAEAAEMAEVARDHELAERARREADEDDALDRMTRRDPGDS